MEIKKSNKNLVIIEIVTAATLGDTLAVLYERVEEICYKYFPECDSAFLNDFRELAYAVQLIAVTTKSINIAVNQYIRENRSKACKLDKNADK